MDQEIQFIIKVDPNLFSKHKGKENEIAVEKLNPTQLRAYNLWRGQYQRCYDKKTAQYKYYGQKGIKVTYSRAEFITWYEHHIKLFKGTNPSIGRIDHSKNYSFDNIEIISSQENSREAWLRNETWRSNETKVGLYCKNTDKLLIIFPSMGYCAKSLGIGSATVSRWCRGVAKDKTACGNGKYYPWYFKYYVEE